MKSSRGNWTLSGAALFIFGITFCAYSADPQFAPGKKIEMPGQTEPEGPTAVDFDLDGKVDLLSGLYSGHILFRKNIGTEAAPKFDKPVKVQSGGKDIKLVHW